MKVFCKMFKTAYGSRTITHDDSREEAEDREISDWTVVSEVFEVEVPMLSKDEQIRNEVATIDVLLKKENEKYFEAIEGLRQRKAELLALTYDGADDERD
jgi:hypothetical protein